MASLQLLARDLKAGDQVTAGLPATTTVTSRRLVTKGTELVIRVVTTTLGTLDLDDGLKLTVTRPSSPGGDQPDPHTPVVLGDLAAYAPAKVPAHAGSRPGRFDPTRSIYNAKASNTRRVRAALAAARAGTGLARITFAGDSLTAGYNATRGTSDPVTFLRSELSRRGYTTGELVNAYTNGLPDTRFSQSTGAALAFPWGDLISNASVSVTGTGTVFEVVSTGVGQPFTVSIDGGATTTFTPNGATSPQVLTVTGLTNAAHTAVITGTTGGANNAYLYAAGFRQAAGVVVQNAGISGAKATDWLAQQGNFGPAWTLFHANHPSHDCVFIDLGINDLVNGGGTAATFAANLGTLVDQARAQTANPPTVVLATSNYPSGGDATWAPWVSAIYDVADSRDVPLLDFADRLGSYTTYNRDGLGWDQASDTLHLTPAGYAHKAAAWAELLTA